MSYSVGKKASFLLLKHLVSVVGGWDCIIPYLPHERNHELVPIAVKTERLPLGSGKIKLPISETAESETFHAVLMVLRVNQKGSCEVNGWKMPGGHSIS